MVDSIKKQLQPKTFYEKPLNKSKGILDDFAVRKSVATRELNTTEGTVENLKVGNELDMQDNKIINLMDPAADQDAATKKYVDDVLTVIGPKKVKMEWYDTGDDGYDSASRGRREGQTFTIGTTGIDLPFTLGEIKALIYTAFTSGSGTFYIYEVDGSGLPTGSSISSGTVDYSTLPSTPTWTTIPMSAVGLNASTKYALVLAGGANACSWRLDESSPTYAGGSRVYDPNTGSWNEDTTRDYMFEIWGAESTDNAAARFAGTSGLFVQNSGVIVDDDDNVTIPGTSTFGSTIVIDGTTNPGTITESHGTLSFDDENLITTGNLTVEDANVGGQINLNSDGDNIITASRVAGNLRLGAGGETGDLIIDTGGNVHIGGNLDVGGTVTGEQITSTDDINMAGYFLNTMSATDTDAFKVNGSTNPYSGTSSFTLFDLDRTFAGQTLGGGQSFKGFKTNLNMSYTLAGLDEANIQATVMENTSTMTAFINAGDYGDWDLILKGLSNTVALAPRFNVTVGDANSIAVTGVNAGASYQGAYLADNNTSHVTVYGARINAGSSPTEVSGYANKLNIDVHGLHVSASTNSKEGTGKVYGIYINTLQGGVTENWAYYNNTSADNFMGTGETQFNGDLTFTGSGRGLPYGYCYGDHINWTQANAAQNTWYPIGDGTDTDMISGELNLCTHDAGLITVAKAGKYLISFDTAYEINAANVHVEFGVEVNGSDPAADSPHVHTTSKFSNQEQQSSGTGIIALTAGQTIQVSMRHIDAATPNFKVDNVHLTCTQIGG